MNFAFEGGDESPHSMSEHFRQYKPPGIEAFPTMYAAIYRSVLGNRDELQLDPA